MEQTKEFTVKLEEMHRRLLEAEKDPKPFMITDDIITVGMVHPNTVAVWRKMKKIVHKDKISVAYLYDRKDTLRFLKNRLKRLQGEVKKPKPISPASDTPSDHE